MHWTICFAHLQEVINIYSRNTIFASKHGNTKVKNNNVIHFFPFFRQEKIMQANILSLFSKVLESKSEGFMLLTKPFARILIRFSSFPTRMILIISILCVRTKSELFSTLLKKWTLIKSLH